MYGNNVMLCSKYELHHFLTMGVLSNEDVTSFTVIDRTRYSAVPLAIILTVLCSEIKSAQLFDAISKIVTFLYSEKKYDIIDDILIAYNPDSFERDTIIDLYYQYYSQQVSF